MKGHFILQFEEFKTEIEINLFILYFDARMKIYCSILMIGCFYFLYYAFIVKCPWVL